MTVEPVGKAVAPRAAWGLSLLLVAGLCLALWMPRLHGPLDLRYDAGVYYLLGTSLYEGKGYQIGSEPGVVEGVQYPPGLPLLVAAHQKVLGTSEWPVVGRWLRRTYFGLFLAYGVVTLAFARRHLGTGGALAATALCLLQVNTFLLSDLLFTELPFALVATTFVLALWHWREREASPAREVVTFLLASAGFFLRTAGVALLAAWVAEALLRRRWRLALLRTFLALLPFGLWQAHVLRVKASADYATPAYAYQRAGYQFYNVTYAENMAYVDPFRPELGRAMAGDLLKRLGDNLAAMPRALGEAVSTMEGFWRWRLHAWDPQVPVPPGAREQPARIAQWCLAALLLVGAWRLVRRQDWGTVVFCVLSVGLVCSTPWPGQMARYLAPLCGLLATATVIGAVAAWQAIPGRAAWPVRGAVALLLALTVATQVFSLQRIHERRAENPAMRAPGGTPQSLYYHDARWDRWGEAARWLAVHAPPDAVVASSSPHLLHLWTGLRAIMPPMEADRARAHALLSGVPVRYVIVDELDFLDIARFYALPALREHPESWSLVHEIGGTQIYERRTGS